MKSLFRRIVAVTLLATLLTVSIGPGAASAAFDPFGNADCAKAKDSAICQPRSGSDPITSSGGILHILVRVIALFAGAVAVIIIVVAGIRYITSNGDAEQVKKSKNAIIYAAIGLIVIVFAQALVSFIINKL